MENIKNLSNELGKLTESIDNLIKSMQDMPKTSDVSNSHDAILDKLPLLDYYNDELKKAKEELDKIN